MGETRQLGESGEWAPSGDVVGSGGSAIPRRRFVGAMAALGLSERVGFGAAEVDAAVAVDAVVAVDFPRQDASRVQSVVGASHGNMDRVRTLVLEQPALAKASWDWGFGDWETPLGAASHTGRREIAEFLIAHGARPTIFSAAMMGELPTVRAFLELDPRLYRLHGPHGISLFRHARAGGADAEPVADYLLDRFGPDEEAFGFPGDATVEERYGGVYAFDSTPPFELTVAVRTEWLMVGPGPQPNSRVLQVERDVFHPTGAPAVRLRFHVEGARATGLTIEDGPVRVRGTRSAS